MKNFFLAAILLILFSTAGLAQKSIDDLSPAHSAALKDYLKKHPDLRFLSEKSYDQEYLKTMRFTPRFTPFYQAGDFNHDGVGDFAVVLKKNVPPKRDRFLAETHQLQYTLAVVVFNGARSGTYRSVFSQTIVAPLVCFLNTTGARKKRLYFGVYETDDGFTLTPTRSGYKAQYLE